MKLNLMVSGNLLNSLLDNVFSNKNNKKDGGV